MLDKKVLKSFRTVFCFSVLMFVLCGLLYPLSMTGLAQTLFPSQANGSLVYVNGEAVGSKLIGQSFQDEKYMKCRPSAVNYNVYADADVLSGEYGGVASGSNNYAASNPALAERVEADIKVFLANNPTVERGEIPTDVLTASGSGLDPHISVDSAIIQIESLSKNTGLPQEKLTEIVDNNTTTKWLGVFGEEAVNVLMVNLEIAKELGLV